MKKFMFIVFGLIVLIIAFFFRFYKLGTTPNGLYVDEAGQGYSAYSILKTGKDEFGKTLPFVFRSMTDFRTPVYTYVIVPFIKTLGLTMFAVRLPSAIFGFLIIPVFYLLILELTQKKSLALISSIILSISPWHLVYSRGAYETNLSLFFLVLGCYLLFRSFKKNYLIIFSAASFAVSLVAYQSERIIIPLILAVIFFKYKKIFLDKKFINYLFLAIIIGVLVSLPVILIANTSGFWARANGLNIFSNLKHYPEGFLTNYKGTLNFLINGRWFLSVREFFGLYMSYLSPRFMFLLGDYEKRTSFPELSTFFVWQFPFYIWGLARLIKERKWKDFKFFAFTSLLIFPIPAAITWDPYSTIRSLPLIIPQISIISYGIYDVFTLMEGKYRRNLSYLVFVTLIVYSIAKLYSSIFVLNDYYRQKYWDWGWQNVAQEIAKLNPSLPVIVDNPRGDVYLQLAFFLKYDPVKYQNENFEVPITEYYTNTFHTSEKHLGNIVTRQINWQKDIKNQEYLVGDDLAISDEQIKEHNLTLISVIKYLDGTVAFKIVKTNPTLPI